MPRRNITITHPSSGRTMSVAWEGKDDPTPNEVRQIFKYFRDQKPPVQPEEKAPWYTEPALTVLEPFYHENIIEAGKNIGRGAETLFASPPDDDLRSGIERVSKGLREVGSGAMGVSAPIVAGLAPWSAPFIGPVSKGLGFATEKVKEGIETVSPASKDFPELTGLASEFATLAPAVALGSKLGKKGKTTPERADLGIEFTDELMNTPEYIPPVKAPSIPGDIVDVNTVPTGTLNPASINRAITSRSEVPGGFRAEPGTKVDKVITNEPPLQFEPRPYEVPEVIEPAPLGQKITETDIKRGIYPTARTEPPIRGKAEPTGIIESKFVEEPLKVEPDITGELKVTPPRPIGGTLPENFQPFTLEEPLTPKVQPKLLPPGYEPFPGREHIISQFEQVSPFESTLSEMSKQIDFLKGEQKKLEATLPEAEAQLRRIEQAKMETVKPTEPSAYDWVKKQETATLEQMAKTAEGKLKEEVEVELANRRPDRISNKAERRQATRTEPNPQQIKPLEFQDYQSDLGYLETRVKSHEAYNVGKDLVPAARKAKAAGITEEQLVQDLIDKGIKVTKAHEAARRVYHPNGENLYFMGLDPVKMIDATRDLTEVVLDSARDLINKAKNPDAAKILAAAADQTKQIGFKENYILPPIDALKTQGPAATQIAELGYKSIDTGKRHSGEFRGTLNKAIKNLTPEDFGNRIATYRGRDRVITRENELRYGSYVNGKYIPKKGVTISVRPGNFIDAVENGATPRSQKVAEAVRIYNMLAERAGTMLANTGANMVLADGTRVPFQPRQNYYTHSYSRSFFESLERNPTLRNEIITNIAKERKISLAQAEQVLKDSRYFGEIFRGFQKQRTAENFDYLRDKSVIYDHFDRMGMRIGQAEILGPLDVKGQKLNDLMTQAALEGGNLSYILQSMNDLLGRNPKSIFSSSDSALYRAASSLNTAMYLSKFVISNTANALLLPARAGMKSIGQSLLELGNLEAVKSRAIKSGALEESYLEDFGVHQNIIGKLYGIKAHETMMRSFANEVGMQEAANLFDYLKKAKNPSKAAKARFEDLIGEKFDNVKNNPNLTEDQSLRAGYRMSRGTQGVIDSLEIPPGWRGKGLFVDLALQYKRFAYIQVMNTVRAMKLDPVRTTATLAVVAPIIGEIVGDTKAAVSGSVAGTLTGEGAMEGMNRELERRGEYYKDFLNESGLDDEQAEIVGKYLDNINQSFALGIFGDFLQAAAFGPEGEAKWAIGGAASAAELFYNFLEAGKGALQYTLSGDEEQLEEGVEPLVRFGENIVPLAGSAYRRSKRSQEFSGSELNFPTVAAP